MKSLMVIITAVLLTTALMRCQDSDAAPAQLNQISQYCMGLTIPEGNYQGYFTLSAASPITTAYFNPFFQNGGPSGATGGYQVPGGNYFHTMCICSWGSNYLEGFQLVSSTAPFANNASSIAGGVYQGGQAAVYPMTAANAGTFNQVACYPVMYEFGPSTYPGVQWASAAVMGGVYIVGKVNTTP